MRTWGARLQDRFSEVLEALQGPSARPLVLISDEHPAYRRAVQPRIPSYVFC